MNDAIAIPAAARTDSRGRVAFALAAGALLALATLALFVLSRGKWSDAVIDSGREWIVPDALARGDLLYRDVVYWFGPFTPYFHAAFFRLFGSSYSTLVAAGVIGSVGVLAALFLALRTVAGRVEATYWTALAIPALVFMPNAGGPILGMGYRIWHAAAFTLAAIGVAATRPGTGRPVLRSAAAGALCGLAGLCRTEWGLVAAASCCLTVLFREGSAAPRLRRVGTVLAAFAVVFGGTIAVFVAVAGSKAVLEDGHVLLYGLPPETREFLMAYSGLRDWKLGILELLYSAAMWAGALLLVQIVAIGRTDRTRVLRKLPLLAGVFLLLILSAALGGAGGAVLFSAAPLVCIVAAIVALARRTASSAALFGFGIAGALLSYRRPFHIGDAAYVGPPLLFAFVCAAGLAQQVIEGERTPATRERLRAGLRVAVVILAVFAFAGRMWQYREDPRVSVPGTQRMISARAELAARLESLVRAVRRESRSGETLVVFPEGEILNYLAERTNPIRHKLYIPGYLTDRNETEILNELRRARPGMVVLWPRPAGEYGRGFFGEDYGSRILAWIQRKYRPIAVSPTRSLSRVFVAYRLREDPSLRGRRERSR